MYIFYAYCSDCPKQTSSRIGNVQKRMGLKNNQQSHPTPFHISVSSSLERLCKLQPLRNFMSRFLAVHAVFVVKTKTRVFDMAPWDTFSLDTNQVFFRWILFFDENHGVLFWSKPLGESFKKIQFWMIFSGLTFSN